MKIQRSLFIALTGALAACAVHEHDGPMPPMNNGGGSSFQGSNNSTPSTPAHTNPPAPPPPPAPHTNPPAPPPAPPPPPSPPSVHPPDHLDPIRPGGACLDSNATTVPPCTVICSANMNVATHCATYALNFEPKVAAAAVSCMNGLRGATGCDLVAANNCGRSALAEACVSASVSQLCGTAAGACKVNSHDCVTLLSGLNAKGQAAVAQCVNNGCANGLYSCIEGLQP